MCAHMLKDAPMITNHILEGLAFIFTLKIQLMGYI